MNTRWQAWLMIVLILLGPTAVWAQRFDTSDVEVDVVDDRGRSFPQYPLRGEGGPAVFKA